MQIRSQNNLRTRIVQISFNPEMTNIIELYFFFIIFHNEMFWNKSRCKLINTWSFNYLMIVIFFRLLVRVEIFSVSERMGINRLWIWYRDLLLLSPGHFVAGTQFILRCSIGLGTRVRCFGKITSARLFSLLLLRTFLSAYYLFKIISNNIDKYNQSIYFSIDICNCTVC